MQLNCNVDEGSPELEDVIEYAKWLNPILLNFPNIVYSAFTGSSLDRRAITRHSDIDLIILIDENLDIAHWVEISKIIKRKIPRLDINVDRFNNFSYRSRLFTCRLLNENVLVTGSPTDAGLIWPQQSNICEEGLVWTQPASAVLFNRLVQGSTSNSDITYEAWYSCKFALNSLRYRFLALGETVTSAREILMLANHDPSLNRDSVILIQEAFDVARDFRTPPLDHSIKISSYLMASLECVHSTSLLLTSILHL